MTPKALLEALAASEEPKGRYLHADVEHCLDIALGLLENQERYGYLCCPCRLACEDSAHDADIVCPCEYSAADVNEFGACFCTLFVSEAYRDDTGFFPDVPERRPPEKIR